MDTQELWNVFLLGPKNSGKSAIAGRLIHDFGSVDQNLMDSMNKEAVRYKLDTAKYPWMVDKLKSARGLSVLDVLSWKCTVGKSTFTLLDGPGRSSCVNDFFDDMSQTIQCACMVVSGRMGEFENDLQQTKDQFLLAKSSGVEQYIVLVSQMDSCDYNQDRFNAIKEHLQEYLMKYGFNPAAIPVLPASWHGDGVVEVGSNMPWFLGWRAVKDGEECKGKTLLEALATMLPVGHKDTPTEAGQEEEQEEVVDPVTQPPPPKKSKLVSLDDYLDEVIDLWEAVLRNTRIDVKALLMENVIMEGESGSAVYQHLTAKLAGRVYYLYVKNLQKKALEKIMDKAVLAVPSILILDGLEHLSEPLSDVVLGFGTKNLSEEKAVWLLGTKAAGATVTSKVDSSFVTVEFQLV